MAMALAPTTRIVPLFIVRTFRNLSAGSGESNPLGKSLFGQSRPQPMPGEGIEPIALILPVDDLRHVTAEGIADQAGGGLVYKMDPIV
jgi:hypothetical protein